MQRRPVAPRAYQTQQRPNPAVVRVRAGRYGGSGVYIVADEQGIEDSVVCPRQHKHGVVLTNWDVVARGANLIEKHPGNAVEEVIRIAFPDGQGFYAKVIKTDKFNDLAWLSIQKHTGVEPLVVASTAPARGQRVTRSGYGPDGNSFRRVATTTKSERGSARIEMNAPGRGGDSGGPVLNENGEIVGLISHTSLWDSYGPSCTAIRRAFPRLFPNKRRQPPIASKPLVPVPKLPTIPITPPASPPSSELANLPAKITRLDERTSASDTTRAAEVLSLTQTLKDVSEAVRASGGKSREAIAGVAALLEGRDASNDEGSTRAQANPQPGTEQQLKPRPTLGPALIAATAVPAWLAPVAIGGPAGVAGLIGWQVIGALWRRQKRKQKEPRAESAQATFPKRPRVPREEQEALELLRLSQAEGRDPLHDALVGRIAFDELDNQIEGGENGQAQWARELKAKLEGTFNKVMPLAIN